MKNMKERKIEPIAVFSIIFSIIGIILIAIVFIRDSKTENQIDTSEIYETEISEFSYSEQELKDFAKAVDERREFEVADAGLEFGEDYYIVKQILLFANQEKLDWYRNGKKQGWNISLNYNDGSKVLQPVYSFEKLKIDDIINKDLSLKHPEVFSGYVFSVKRINTLEEWSKAQYGEFIDYSYDKTMRQAFNEWAQEFKTFDKQSFENNITIDDVNNYIEKIINDSIYEYDYYKINNSHLIDNVDKIFGDSKEKAISFNNKKESPMNRLFQFYNLRPRGTYTLGNLINNFNIEKTNIPVFPQEYNLFNKIGNDYIINYYPKKVELKNNVLKITLKIDNPITDSLQVIDIVNKISHYFRDENNLGKIYKNFDLIISFDYNNIACGIFDEFDSYSLIHEGFINSEDYNSDLVILNNMAPWYPNKEAQEIIKDVFANVSNHYVDDTQYSIFKEIEKVSKEKNIEYEKAESIVINYLWQSFTSW